MTRRRALTDRIGGDRSPLGQAVRAGGFASLTEARLAVAQVQGRSRARGETVLLARPPGGDFIEDDQVWASVPAEIRSRVHAFNAERTTLVTRVRAAEAEGLDLDPEDAARLTEVEDALEALDAWVREEGESSGGPGYLPEGHAMAEIVLLRHQEGPRYYDLIEHAEILARMAREMYRDDTGGHAALPEVDDARALDAVADLAAARTALRVRYRAAGPKPQEVDRMVRRLALVRLARLPAWAWRALGLSEDPRVVLAREPLYGALAGV